MCSIKQEHSMATTESALEALKNVVDPESGKHVLQLDMIRDLRCEDGKIHMTVQVHDPMASFSSGVEQACREALSPLVASPSDVRLSVDNDMIDLGEELTVDGASQSNGFAGARNIVAVASGKGGVGKSTVSVNLAVALAQQGFSVGLVDTDIYGPSIPTMFGVEDAKPKVAENRRIVPIERYGVKLLSMGFLVDPKKAVVWRGPMVTSAVKQFLSDTEWGDLDYLILDLPPGTGDIQLTIVQTVPLNGAVVVSTPQRVALADARKGVAMFDQVHVPVLGLVENMAWFEPPDVPGRRYYLFGEGGAKALAEELNVPLLGQLPIEEDVRRNCDEGTPAAAHKDTTAAAAFGALARRVTEETWRRNATRPATQKVEILRR